MEPKGQQPFSQRLQKEVGNTPQTQCEALQEAAPGFVLLIGTSTIHGSWHSISPTLVWQPTAELTAAGAQAQETDTPGKQL